MKQLKKIFQIIDKHSFLGIQRALKTQHQKYNQLRKWQKTSDTSSVIADKQKSSSSKCSEHSQPWKKCKFRPHVPQQLSKNQEHHYSRTQRIFSHLPTVGGNVECTAILENNMAISYKTNDVAKNCIPGHLSQKIKMYAHVPKKNTY